MSLDITTESDNSNSDLMQVIEDFLERDAEENLQGLTEEELSNIISYNRADSQKSEGGRCTICNEDSQNSSEVIYLWCRHSFHFNCIKEWLQKHRTCSLCRRSLKPIYHRQKAYLKMIVLFY